MDVVFYRDHRGAEQVVEYMMAARRTDDRSAAGFRRLVEALQESGPPLGMPHDRLIDPRNRVFELRFGPHRVAYIEHAGRTVLLSAWRKRSQELDRLELARARARAADWRTRK
jgi:hypothetical protein